MKLGEMAAAMWLLAAAPVFAQQQPGADDFGPPKASDTSNPAPAPVSTKRKTKTKSSAPASSPVAAPAAPALGPALAPPPSVPAKSVGSTPATSTAGDIDLTLEDSHSRSELSLDGLSTPNGNTKLEPNTLCILPFTTTSGEGASLAGELRNIFVSVARKSTFMKLGPENLDTVPDCKRGKGGVACLARFGLAARCSAVLAGEVERLDTGLVLRARIIDVATPKELSHASRALDEENGSFIRAWAQGQACRALKANCAVSVTLDIDRKNVSLLLDNSPYEHAPATPVEDGSPQAYRSMVEVHDMEPGLHTLEAYVDESLVRKPRMFAVNLDFDETIFIRQLHTGTMTLVDRVAKKGMPISSADIPPSEKLDTKLTPVNVVGIVAAGLGVIAEGVAIQQFEHSQSLANGAANNYAANGYYKPADLSAISSARSAHTNSTVLTAVGAGLVVVGAVLFFAF